MGQMVACPECGKGVNIQESGNVSVHTNEPDVPDGYTKNQYGNPGYEKVIEQSGTYNTRKTYVCRGKACPDGHKFYISHFTMNERYTG